MFRPTDLVMVEGRWSMEVSEDPINITFSESTRVLKIEAGNNFWCSIPLDQPAPVSETQKNSITGAIGDLWEMCLGVSEKEARRMNHHLIPSIQKYAQCPLFCISLTASDRMRLGSIQCLPFWLQISNSTVPHAMGVQVRVNYVE